MLHPHSSRMLVVLLVVLVCDAVWAQNIASPDPFSTLPGDRPLSVFRRAQDDASCPDAETLIAGSTVVANSGALYHVAESQTHAVRLTVGDNARLRGFRFWCFAPACTLENPPCDEDAHVQNLGQTFMALYESLPPPEEGVTTQVAGTVSVAATQCRAGWNTLELEGEALSIEPGDYWIVMSHVGDWQTAYAPGTQLIRSSVGSSSLPADLTASGFVTFDAHAPSSSVPLAATMCDESNSRACLDQCIGENGQSQPDWSDPSTSCFWLLRHVDQDFECISTCGEGLALQVRRDVLRCQEGYDGFSADLSDNIHVVGESAGLFMDIPGPREYETAGMGGRHALFSYGSGFDVRNGVYTANTAGLYLVTANVRLGGANQGDMVAAAIEINGESEAGNGLTVRQHNIRSATGTEGLWTLTMCGVVQLAVADTMNLAVSVPADDDFYIETETGFHAVLLQTHSGFAAALTQPIAVGGTGSGPTPDSWMQLTSFNATGSGMFDQLYSEGDGDAPPPLSVFDAAAGIFTAPADGLYFTSASIRLANVIRVPNAANFITKISIALNSVASGPDVTEGTGLTTIGSDEPNSLGDRHEVVTGVLRLNQGDTLSVWIQVEDAETFSIESESSFTAVAMESQEGFEVQLIRDTAVTNRESFVEITGFRTAATHAESPSLFATTLSSLGFASGLDTQTGRYTAGFPGVYFAQTTVRFGDANEGNFIRVVIALNGEVQDETNGEVNGAISAISGEIDDRTKDIDASGLLSLDVGDFFSVWVNVGGDRSQPDDDYVVLRQTRFASVFITSPPRALTQCPDGEQPNLDYNGDTCSDCLASGASCARCANVFGFDCSCACVAEECTEVPNDQFGGDTCSDCLHSGASCEDCRSDRFNFDCDCACNENDEWAFWRPDRCFEVDCGRRGFCYEGSCLCVDGYRGANCIIPPGQGMRCSDRLHIGQTCDNSAGEQVVSLGSATSQASCRNLCQAHAESGTPVEHGFGSSVCSSRDESLSDFVHGDKWGLSFVWEPDSHNDANDPLLTTCDSWGYAGATQMDVEHSSNRGGSYSLRNAVFTQPAAGQATQNIEWYFCDARAVTNIDVFPLHAGHEMQRGTMQYMENGEWITVGEAAIVNTPTGQGLSMTSDGTICAQRWRIADWRCEDNQRMDGIDLHTADLSYSDTPDEATVEAGCCQWNGEEDGTMANCEYIRGATETVEGSGVSAAVCELTDIRAADDDYSLIVDDCTDIQPVTARLVEAVIKLHSQLQNRACVDGYFENEFGICEPTDPVPEPVVSVMAEPRLCTGRNPSRRGEQIECAFLGDIVTVPGPTGDEEGHLAGMRFASDDAMVLLHPFATSTAGGFPLSSRDNPEGEWTLDTWIRTPLEPGQWRTLARGATGDSQVLVAPAQESTWTTATYTGSVGSLTTDESGYFYGSTDPPEVTNWDVLGSFDTPGTTIPDENARPLAQDYYTDLVQDSRMSLGTYTGSGGDAGAGLPDKFTDTGFDISTLDAGV